MDSAYSKPFIIMIECPHYGERPFLLPDGEVYFDIDTCRQAIEKEEKRQEEDFKRAKEYNPKARRGKIRKMRPRQISLV